MLGDVGDPRVRVTACHDDLKRGAQQLLAACRAAVTVRGSLCHVPSHPCARCCRPVLPPVFRTGAVALALSRILAGI